MFELLKEAVAVGILTVVIGNMAGFAVGLAMSADLPVVCKDWNKYYAMEISLFITGVLAHLICEFSGINKLYCKNGLACKEDKQ